MNIQTFFKLIQIDKIYLFFKERERLTRILSYAFIGVLLFLLIYGFTPLNVTNDHFIINEYIERDVVQHYAGWVAYRNSAWGMPLGEIKNLDGTMLTYMDSIPWVSIFYKLFSPILPKTFQFFGLYILLCFILQAVSSGMLIEQLSKSRAVIYGSVLIFTTAPVMLERAFRHTALASHWLILFPLYLCVISRRSLRLHPAYILMCVLSIGIHPYFMPFVFALLLLSYIDLILKKKKFDRNDTLVFVLAFVLTIAAGYLIGALGSGTEMSSIGYGYFGLNLNSAFNPLSRGMSKWSMFLPVLPQTLGNFDGFSYLGVGIIALFILTTFVLIKKKLFLKLLKNNLLFAVLCIMFTFYAISNVVTLNSHVLFEIKLPEWLVTNVFGIFRAGSRMFYLPYYVIFIYSIYGLGFIRPDYRRIAAVSVAALQLVDLSPAFIEKHNSFNPVSIEEKYEQCEFISDEWSRVFESVSKIRVLNKIDSYQLAAFCAIHKVPTDHCISVPMRGDRSADYNGNLNDIVANRVFGKEAFLTNDSNIVTFALASNSGVCAYKVGSCYVIVSDNNRLEGLTQVTEQDCVITASDYSNSDWDRGVSRGFDNRIILFRYTQAFMEFLKEKTAIGAHGDVYTIEEIESDEYWIRIRVDRSALGCQNPEPLSFK